MDELTISIIGITITENILYVVLVLLAVALLLSIGFFCHKADENYRDEADGDDLGDGDYDD